MCLFFPFYESPSLLPFFSFSYIAKLCGDYEVIRRKPGGSAARRSAARSGRREAAAAERGASGLAARSGRRVSGEVAASGRRRAFGGSSAGRRTRAKIAPGPVPGEAWVGPKALGALLGSSADNYRGSGGASVRWARSGSGGSARAEGALARRRRGGVRGAKGSPTARAVGKGAPLAEGFGNRGGSRERPAGR